LGLLTKTNKIKCLIAYIPYYMPYPGPYSVCLHIAFYHNTSFLRERFSFSEELVDSLIEFIRTEGEFVASEPIKIEISDESESWGL